MESRPPASFIQKIMGFTLCMSSSILNNQQQSLWVSSQLSIANNCVQNFLLAPLRSKKPQAEFILPIDRFSCSYYRSNLTVSTFKNSATRLASAVFLNLGLLTKSRMREMGMAVSPHAPQQARMGYPMRQKNATTKQMMLLEKCRCSDQLMAP